MAFGTIHAGLIGRESSAEAASTEKLPQIAAYYADS